MARAQRSDACRNRDRLLECAAEAFAEHGVDAPLEKIAKSACVGIGTLYRHYPTRDHTRSAHTGFLVATTDAAQHDRGQADRPGWPRHDRHRGRPGR